MVHLLHFFLLPRLLGTLLDDAGEDAGGGAVLGVVALRVRNARDPLGLFLLIWRLKFVGAPTHRHVELQWLRSLRVGCYYRIIQ